MSKKYELTPEHCAQLGPWRDRWIANATRAAAWEATRVNVSDATRAAAWEATRVNVSDATRAATLAAATVAD